jgi:hypothetical protein
MTHHEKHQLLAKILEEKPGLLGRTHHNNMIFDGYVRHRVGIEHFHHQHKKLSRKAARAARREALKTAPAKERRTDLMLPIIIQDFNRGEIGINGDYRVTDNDPLPDPPTILYHTDEGAESGNPFEFDCYRLIEPLSESEPGPDPANVVLQDLIELLEEDGVFLHVDSMPAFDNNHVRIGDYFRGAWYANPDINFPPASAPPDPPPVAPPTNTPIPVPPNDSINDLYYHQQHEVPEDEFSPLHMRSLLYYTDENECATTPGNVPLTLDKYPSDLPLNFKIFKYDEDLGEWVLAFHKLVFSRERTILTLIPPEYEDGFESKNVTSK